MLTDREQEAFLPTTTSVLIQKQILNFGPTTLQV